jgi:hypothetical protein
VRHGRNVVFQLAELAVPRALFAAILRRIDRRRGAARAGDVARRSGALAETEGGALCRKVTNSTEAARRRSEPGHPACGYGACCRFKIRCEVVERDRHGRLVASCFSANGVDIVLAG